MLEIILNVTVGNKLLAVALEEVEGSVLRRQRLNGGNEVALAWACAATSTVPGIAKWCFDVQRPVVRSLWIPKGSSVYSILLFEVVTGSGEVTRRDVSSRQEARQRLHSFHAS